MSAPTAEANLGLVHLCANRFRGRGIEYEELYSAGCIGLLKAVKAFDQNRGVQFSTYAVPKISGEIRRFLRDDGSVKVSRGLKERAAAVKMTRSILEQRFNREPTLSELSAETGFTPEEIAECETATATADSLQRETGDEGFTLEHMLGDDGQEDKLIENISLRQAIAELPEKEQMVILLRYYRGMTQEAAARILHVSQVQVSRIERRAIEKLRAQLK